MTFGRRRGGGGGRLIAGVVMAVIALISYFASAEYNPVTEEKQYIALTPDQEIALGLQATPQLVQQYGGLYPDENHQQFLDSVGFGIVNSNPEIRDLPWEYEFHLLDDEQTINAFALPGGQVFITAALYGRLETSGQLAGVLGHEIGHVLARHSAQRIAKENLANGLTGAVAVASGNAGAAQAAAMIGALVNMKYGREDELQSDRIGVRLMGNAGYDPRSMVRVMEILGEASSGNRQPEFFSTHPNPENRIARIEEAVAEEYPNGVPEGLAR